MEPIFIIALVSLIGPLLGSLIGVLKKPSEFFMFNILAFSAGVMLAISFLDLVPQSVKFSSIGVCAAGIVFGSIVMFFIDKAIPHIHPSTCGPHPPISKYKNLALYIFIGIFIHNIPEGMAMGIGVVTDFQISLAIAIAITIHDIPEGICTSAPYYYATNKRLRSFLISASTIIPTLIGLFFAHYLFSYLPLNLVGFLIGATAGLMVYISADELIPTSCGKLSGHSTTFSLMAGVVLVVLIGLI